MGHLMGRLGSPPFGVHERLPHIVNPIETEHVAHHAGKYVVRLASVLARWIAHDTKAVATNPRSVPNVRKAPHQHKTSRSGSASNPVSQPAIQRPSNRASGSARSMCKCSAPCEMDFARYQKGRDAAFGMAAALALRWRCTEPSSRVGTANTVGCPQCGHRVGTMWASRMRWG